MNLQSCNVLLVDDDEEEYILVREMLADIRRQRFFVEWVSNYQDGLDKLMTGQYDVALVDFDLGVQSGLDMIREAVAGDCRIPIIMLTGLGSYEVDLEAMHAGAVDYLGKNEATPALLERTIRYAIDHHQSEQELYLQKNELEIKNQQLQGMFNHAPVGLALFDSEPPYQVQAHNRVYQEFWPEPFSSEGMVGKYFTDYAVRAEEDGFLSIFREVANSEQGRTLYKFPYDGMPGGRTWWNWTLSPIYSEGRLVAFSQMMVDMTEEVRAIERLKAEMEERKKTELAREVQRQLMHQRELERMRIARDLHDGPLQDVIGASFTLVAAMEIPEQGLRLEKMQQVHEVMQKNVRDLRQFCNELRPPTLSVLGLDGLIRSHANTFRERYANIQVELNLKVARGQQPARMPLPEDMSMALYRAYQEAMNNVSRHSRTPRVAITLEIDEAQVRLEVKDAGIGFEVPDDWTEVVRQGHLGIIGMQERMEVVGGTMEILSAPGQGTVVRFYVPTR